MNLKDLLAQGIYRGLALQTVTCPADLASIFRYNGRTTWVDRIGCKVDKWTMMDFRHDFKLTLLIATECQINQSLINQIRLLLRSSYQDAGITFQTVLCFARLDRF